MGIVSIIIVKTEQLARILMIEMMEILNVFYMFFWIELLITGAVQESMSKSQCHQLMQFSYNDPIISAQISA